MFASIGFNQGISAPEIAALDEWGHALMRRAWTYKNKKWPARLYHYTTAEGFKGIIETGVLRGTHVGFTNDFQEYKHAADVALEHAQTLKAQTTSDNQKALLDAVCENLAATNLFGMHPFGIACFSEHPDKLSQWRAYGMGEGGISIGFDTQALVVKSR